MGSFERLAGERVSEFNLLVKFISMSDDRSLYKLSKQCGKSVSTLKRLSTRNNWIARCEAYQSQLACIRLKEQESSEIAQIESFKNRKKESSRKLLATAMRLLDKLQDQLDNIDFSRLLPHEVFQAVRNISYITQHATDAEGSTLLIQALLDLDVVQSQLEQKYNDD